MSTLKTHNLQSPDAGSVNIALAPNAGMVVTGISTFNSDIVIPDKIVHAGDTNTAIRFPAADTVSFETAGTERLRITSDGKVGINRTPTQHPLEIQHASEPTVSLWRGSTKGAALQAQSGGTYLYSYQNAPLVFSVNSGSGFAERLSITHAGQVKIPISGKLAVGPTSPSARFTVGPANGSTNIEIEEYGVIRGYNRNSSAWSKIEFEGSHYIFDTDGSEKFRITSQGYVTKPNQPAWHAWGANSWTSYSGANNLVTFPYSDTNIGSHYKTSGSDAGKFVCPVAGTYFFYCSIYSGRSDNSQTDNSDYMAINFFSDSNNLANKGGHHIAPLL